MILQANSVKSSSSISDTPLRGSWATFDLRQTASDAFVSGLLDRLAHDAIDNVNKIQRTEIQLVITILSLLKLCATLLLH